jgi:predicted nucleotidyltransferase
VSASEFDFLIAKVSHLLEQFGLAHGIVGSIASARYGENRSTFDVDVVVDFQASKLESFCQALEAEFYVDQELILEALERKTSFNIVHLETGTKFDFFIPKPRAYDRVALARRLETVPAFLQAEDVLLGKLEWYKATDCTSERQWRDVLGMLRFSSLDLEYSMHWAREIGVLDLLERALKEV